MKETNLRERFRLFDERNPDIYELFKKMSKQIKRGGFKRYGAWAIFNVIRWEIDLKSTGEPFKISNDFIALYSRKLIKEDKSFAKFFGIRPMKR